MANYFLYAHGERSTDTFCVPAGLRIYFYTSPKNSLSPVQAENLLVQFHNGEEDELEPEHLVFGRQDNMTLMHDFILSPVPNQTARSGVFDANTGWPVLRIEKPISFSALLKSLDKKVKTEEVHWLVTENTVMANS